MIAGKWKATPEWSTLKDYMNSEEKDNTSRPPAGPANKDEVALELMRFIAATTGMGKTSAGAGIWRQGSKTPEEQVDALIQLYERCRPW